MQAVIVARMTERPHGWMADLELVGSRPAGADAEDITRLLTMSLAPLTADEVDGIARRQRNPFPPGDPLAARWQPIDAGGWQLPAPRYAESYLDLLRWSNGPEVRNGEREFGFFATSDVRDYLLDYELPEYMPGAVPIGLDGGGIFCVFDMREPPADGECAILATSAGNLGWEDAVVIAPSFPEFCSGSTPVSAALG